MIEFDSNGLAKSSGFLDICVIDQEIGLYHGQDKVHIIEGYGKPANCLDIAPPQLTEGKVAKYDGKRGWEILDDFRGKIVYEIQSGQSLEIKDVGPIPEGYTLVSPPQLQAGEILGGFDTSTEKWTVNPPSALFQAKANYKKYTDAYFAGLPIDNLPPDQVMEKAKALAAWIKQAEANGEK